jgi:PPOX class probable F420-dependent enzyme
MALDPTLRQLATAKNFAAMTTLMPDGQPQTQIMWVHATDDHLIINTETGRQKYRNVEADPRVTITVFDVGNPYAYVEARGRVVATQTGDAAADNIDELSEKYQGTPYPADTSARVILTIEVDRIHKNNV